MKIGWKYALFSKSLQGTPLNMFTIVAVCLSIVFLCACDAIKPASEGPTEDTFVEVPNSDFALWNDTEKKFDQWNSWSFERAAATKLTYKELVFYPQLERSQMEKAIDSLSIDDLLKQPGD
ncbi:MAG: hypothetical protein JSS83_05265, partial [Cyanobacteria bacterium SZAS LIN-3]|nr:hypothetical protein [Cyanobacteria bacterium SZAS LIN-3]